MPSRKVLKAAGHNFGHSFLSVMNFADGMVWMETRSVEPSRTDTGLVRS